MIAPASTQSPAYSPATIPVPTPAIHTTPDPAHTLAALGKRCTPGGGCPYTLTQIVDVLAALRRHGVVVATEIAREVQLPASAVYGCVLELEDYGLCRWIPEPVLSADYVTAEITAHGTSFLREIKHSVVGENHAG